MTQVQVCTGCGKLFGFLPRGVCPDCQDQREQAFGRVRDYLRDHPGTSIEAVSVATGIDEGTIMSFVRQGRLERTEFAAAEALQCELCGVPVTAGRHCVTCRARLVSGIKVVAEETAAAAAVEPRSDRRMHWRHPK